MLFTQYQSLFCNEIISSFKYHLQLFCVKLLHYLLLFTVM